MYLHQITSTTDKDNSNRSISRLLTKSNSHEYRQYKPNRKETAKEKITEHLRIEYLNNLDSRGLRAKYFRKYLIKFTMNSNTFPSKKTPWVCISALY